MHTAVSKVAIKESDYRSLQEKGKDFTAQQV